MNEPKRPKWLRRICNYCPASAVCFAFEFPGDVEGYSFIGDLVKVECFCPTSRGSVMWKSVSFTVPVSKLKRSDE